MLRQDELGLVYSLKEEYKILVCNAHDIRLRSEITGHEWIIISPYDGSSSELLHRHSNRNPFHHQGRYGSLSSALNYISGTILGFTKRCSAGKFASYPARCE